LKAYWRETLPSERERKAEELKDYGCDTGQFSGDAIFSYSIVRISKVITNEQSQTITSDFQL
jgi:hypothetical protein